MLTRINTNVMALNSQRALNNNTTRLAVSMERLSSGLRINRAADDPSGLVLSETLRAQVSGLDIVQQNVTEGINLVKTAEGALTEVNALLRQMNDLAVRASSDSNNTADSRASLQSQLSSARTTIEKIATNTKYAGVGLLDGSVGDKITMLDSGHIASAKLSEALPAASALLGVNVTAAAAKATVTGDEAFALSSTVLTDNMTLVLNGKLVGQFTTTNTAQDVVDAVNASSADTGVVATHTATEGIKLTAAEYGTAHNFTIAATDQTDGSLSTAFNSIATAGAGGANASATFNTKVFTSTSGLTLTNGSDSIELTATGNAIANHANAIDFEANSASFQIGLTVGETADISINDMRTAALGISTLDISTVAGAQAGLATLGTAMTTVTTLRGQLGAFQLNELEAQGRSVAVSRENLAASESSVRDTDFGKEMANFATSQILVQSATSFLAQANSMPQNILSLIRG